MHRVLKYFIVLCLFISVSINLYVIFVNPNLLNTSLQGTATPIEAGHESSSSALLHSLSPKSHVPTLPTASKTLNKMIDQANDYFKVNNFTNSITTYSEIKVLDINIATDMKLRWLEKSLLFAPELQKEMYQVFLKHQPYDAHLLFYEAKLEQSLNNTMSAIELLFEALNYAHSESLTADIRRYISTIVDKHISRLFNLGLWRDALTFSEAVLVLEPNWSELQLLQAEALLNLGNFSDAERIANLWLTTEGVNLRAQQIIALVKQRRFKKTAIPIVKHNEQYIVAGSFNNLSSVNLLIDTGASLTVISASNFDKMATTHNVEFSRYQLFNTANGTVNAPVYKAQHFQVAHFIVNDFYFAVLDLNSDNFDGLLGMNFLHHFNFQIDRSEDLLLLEFQ